MKNLLEFVIILSLCELGFSWQFPRNADQTLWAYRSCQRNGKNPELVEKWKKWELTSDEESFCYVKCVWKYLGAYNEVDNSIKTETVKTQFRSRGLEVPEAIKLLQGTTDGSCKAVFQKTIKFFAKEKDNIRHAYYGTSDESNKWFSEHPEEKPKGVKISQFCNGQKMHGCASEHACSFYYHRLVDEDNLVVPFSPLPGYPEDKLKECREKAATETGCKVIDVLSDCLREDSEKLEATLKELDERSEKY